jgi:inner membrane protein
MKQRFYVKLGIIFALILALLIPQSFLMDLVNERTAYRQQACQSIEQSWSSAQTLAGPVLIVPYHLTYNAKEKVIVNKKETIKVTEVTPDEFLYLIPKQLHIESKLESSTRYRGIYQIPVYDSQLQVKGEFTNQALLNVISANKDKKIRWDKPQLSVLVTDQRGIAAPPSLMWNSAQLAFEPDVNLPRTTAGMHSTLPELATDIASTVAFDFNLKLRGMIAMSFSLLSENTQVQLAANWANPSFIGELLPEKRDITA